VARTICNVAGVRNTAKNIGLGSFGIQIGIQYQMKVVQI